MHTPKKLLQAGIGIAGILFASIPKPTGIQSNKSAECIPDNLFAKGKLHECASFPQVPAGMSEINGQFYIDRFEASVGIYKDKELYMWSPYVRPDLKQHPKLQAFSIMGIIPQGYVDGYTAEKLCKNSGKRLCTAKEWMSACRGNNKFIYPYGNKRIEKFCNGSRDIHPAIELFGQKKSSFQKIQSACINQLKNSLYKTGAFKNCSNEYFVYDMVGNLHEWISDASGTFKGGYYVDTKINGPGCLYQTTAHSKRHWDYSTGFRCCKSIADTK